MKLGSRGEHFQALDLPQREAGALKRRVNRSPLEGSRLFKINLHEGERGSRRFGIELTVGSWNWELPPSIGEEADHTSLSLSPLSRIKKKVGDIFSYESVWGVNCSPELQLQHLTAVQPCGKMFPSF